MLVAGLSGAAAAAVVGQRASATPPTTEPPERPTDGDVTLLAFAQQVELTARDLYQTALDEGAAGDEDRVLQTCQANHQAAADSLSALLGTAAPGTADDLLYEQWVDRFASSDLQAVAMAGYELENTLVVSHTELVGALEGLEGATTIAAVLIMQARMCTVLADLSGQGDDFAALFDNTATALTPPSNEG